MLFSLVLGALSLGGAIWISARLISEANDER